MVSLCILNLYVEITSITYPPLWPGDPGRDPGWCWFAEPGAHPLWPQATSPFLCVWISASSTSPRPSFDLGGLPPNRRPSPPVRCWPAAPVCFVSRSYRRSGGEKELLCFRLWWRLDKLRVEFQDGVNECGKRQSRPVIGWERWILS